MANFTRDLGFHNQSHHGPDDPKAKQSSVGIWDGKELLFTGSKYGWVTSAKLLWRYGTDLIHVSRAAQDTAAKFGKVYTTETKHPTIDALLKELGLYDLCKETANEYVQKSGVGERLQRELLSGATRCNYGQELSAMHTLGYAIAMVGSDDQVFSVVEGNQRVVETLAETSGATIRTGTKVTAVAPCGGDSSRQCVAYEGSDGTGGEGFDAVVIAAPLEVAGMKLQPMNVSLEHRKYMTIHVTLVQGTMDPTYFGKKSIEQVPATILTAAGTQPFLSVGMGGYGKTLGPVYKIFSLEALEDSTLNRIFTHTDMVRRHVWTHAFPALVPNPEFAPFVLSPGIFYSSGYESAMSCMECMAVAANHVVRLARAHVQKTTLAQ
eukprot:comp23208_c0_seq1/m.37721 comp23208_c0_seq1/g.37721  ORF comp23208_c0_seq1/g.37721 comp23208_c0_seq1/m.37721 type:complete len:379 (-) comp23208_c0_seq1:489-1625(-)